MTAPADSSSRRRVPKPTADSASSATSLTPNFAPVISPSQRMQEIRSSERQAAEAAKIKDQTKPSITLTPVAKPLESGVAQSEPSGSAAGFPQSLTPAEQSVAKGVQLPSRIPSLPIPRPEDLMPADALLQQAPTSQLHPTAQSTWSSATQPLRFLTDQRGLEAAHFFKAPTPAEPAGAASQQPVPTGLGPQLVDQNQFEALHLPMKY